MLNSKMCIYKIISSTLLCIALLYSQHTIAAVSCSVWDDTDWQYRKLLTIQSSKVTATLTDFPVLISLTDTDLDNDAQSDGDDIYFTASDGVTNLSHELEYFDPINGEIVAWVKIPSLSSSTNTEIYMYYGNATVGPQENPSAVWDSNYKSIHHLHNDFLDSTTNNNDATNSGSNDDTTSKFADGQRFNGTSDYINLGNDTSLQITGEVTVEAWVKPDVSGEYDGIGGKLNTATDDGYAIAKHSGNKYRMVIINGASNNVLESDSTYTDTNWHHIAGVRRGGTNYLYVDGVQQAQTGTLAFTDSGNIAFIGRQYDDLNDRYWDGEIDEFRISNVGRSSDWLQTQYNNHDDPGTFYTIGNEETYCGGGGLACSVWDDTNWQYRKYMAIQSSMVTATLTNFPVLIDTTDTDLQAKAQADGDDIYFTSDDGVTNLDHEIEHYDSATGHLVAWVKIPTLSSSTNTEIYMYYGNASATDMSNPIGVWDSSYKSVHHLHNDFLDSTSNNNDATNSGSNDDTTSKFADGQRFNGTSDYINLGNDTSLQITGEVTVEAWVKPDVSGEYDGIGGKLNTVTDDGYAIAKHSGNKYRMVIINGASNNILESDSTYTDTNWHHIAGVRRGGTNYLYVDGVQQAATGTLAFNDSGNIAFIGRQYDDLNDRYWDGEIDEFRISSVGRSSDWIQTQYNNQNNPSGFISIDPEMESCPPAGNGLACDVWDDSTWLYRKYIALQSSQVTANLSNFPVLIDRTDTDLRDNAQADGDDIYFTSSDGFTNLDHEIELYDSSTGHLVAWVRVPTLSSTTDTEIYMYYGNASAPDQSNPTGVWDSNYETVWHLAEDPGPGAANDIKDSTSNAHHGQAETSMTTGDLVTGQMGKSIDFDGSDDYLNFGDINELDGINKLTVSAWVEMEMLDDWEAAVAKGVSSGQAWLLHLSSAGDNGGGTNDIRPAVRDGGNTSIDTHSDILAVDGQYHYWTMVFDGTQTGNLNRLKFYFDGSEVTLIDNGGTIPAATDNNSGSLWIGANPYEAFSRLDAKIDEVRTSTSVRSSDWIQTEYNNQNSPSSFAVFDTQMVGCLSNPADHHVISHDNAGVHCLNENITVTAYDNVPAVITDYNRDITLDTQSGKGTWSLVTGTGSFTDSVANDGLATYTFNSADNGTATFALSYTEGTASIDIDSFETANSANRDDDTEGNITFSATGFTVTASALANPPPNPINNPIATQTAGTVFNMHIAAYGTTDTDSACGIIETYTGTKSLKFWQGYDNPSTGTLTSLVDATTIAATEAASVGQNVTFTNGQAQVTVKYKDVGSIAINMKDAVDTTITGASNNFVAKPDSFSFNKISLTDDVTLNPGTIIPTGTIFLAAGDPFKVVVDVLDSEGSLTPNYGNETVAEGLILTHALVEPSGGASGALTNANSLASSAANPPGRFTTTTLSWDEVGAITLTVNVADSDYLGTGDVSQVSGNVGRFIPSYFDVSQNTPSFDTYCSTFTYIGQPFNYGTNPVLTITARNAAGGTTTNYANSWWRLNAPSYGISDYSVNTGTFAAVSALPAPSVSPNNDGTGTLTYTSGSGLYFQRTSSTPSNEFNAEISFDTNIIDQDGVSYNTNPYAFGAPTPSNGIAFSGNKEMRYGRLVIDNAHGSDLSILSPPVYVQTFNNAIQDFMLNVDDNCTNITLAHFSCNYTPAAISSSAIASLTAGSQLIAGTLGLDIAAAGQRGNVDMEVNLNAIGSGVACAAVTRTNAGLPWLQYDWPTDGAPDGTPDDNPQGIATYGVSSGQATVIYFRETWR